MARGERVLLVAEDLSGKIVGTVQMITSMPDNQTHRDDIAKMLVHRTARRCGIAGRLMAAIDDAARAEGKTLLVLDTVTGSDAERLYMRAGWERVGDVPKYVLMPNGDFCGTTFFFTDNFEKLHLSPLAGGSHGQPPRKLEKESDFKMEMQNIPFGITNWSEIERTEHKGEREREREREGYLLAHPELRRSARPHG